MYDPQEVEQLKELWSAALSPLGSISVADGDGETASILLLARSSCRQSAFAGGREIQDWPGIGLA